MTKILLVEDDKSLREIYGVRLLAEGYDIVSAGDGEEALAMAIKEKPTLIISDVMMPKISGFDMLDILRSTTETRDIKVIMMTALSSDDQRTRGEQLGADRYLVKSQVGIEDVVRTVHEVLGDVPGAAAPTAAAAPATPASEPASDTAAPAADVAIEEPAPLASAIAVPGNDAAGPLPPQPVVEADESESTLPQPTAPFTSPRPANLGVPTVDPVAATDDATAPVTDPATDPTVDPVVEPADAPLSPEESSQLSQELTATAEPTPQVDPLSSPVVSPEVSPIAGPEAAPAAPTLDPYGQPAQAAAPEQPAEVAPTIEPTDTPPATPTL